MILPEIARPQRVFFLFYLAGSQVRVTRILFRKGVTSLVIGGGKYSSQALARVAASADSVRDRVPASDSRNTARISNSGSMG
jgi:hypothetical protein